MSKRKQYKPEFQAKVALKALKGEQTALLEIWLWWAGNSKSPFEKFSLNFSRLPIS